MAATAECRQPQYSTGYSQPARRIRHSGWDNAGPECHSPHDLVTGHATYNPRTIQMEGGASNMSDPLGRRNQRIQLCGVALDQEKSVQVASVWVEEHDIESLNRTLLLQAAKVLHELLEVLCQELTGSNQTA